MAYDGEQILIICGSLVGVLVGTELASRLPGPVLKKVFAAFLVIAAIRMFLAPTKPSRAAFDNSMTNQQTVSSTEHGETNNEPEN